MICKKGFDTDYRCNNQAEEGQLWCREHPQGGIAFKATKPYMNWDPTVKALGVLVLTPKVRAFLEKEDPKALEQAIKALEEVGFAPTQGTLRERP